MANYSVLTKLIDGVQRSVDLSTNTLVVDTLKVGGGSGTDLTKTILDTLTNGSDASVLHNHDTQYFTKTQIQQATGTTGSDLVGDDDTYSNFTPSAATVKGALQGIDTALGTTTGANKTLSNLDSPTAINQTLQPDDNNDVDLGAPDKIWANSYQKIAHTEEVEFFSPSDSDLTGTATANILGATTMPTSGAESVGILIQALGLGAVGIATQDQLGASQDSLPIILATGASDSGVRGSVIIQALSLDVAADILPHANNTYKIGSDTLNFTEVNTRAVKATESGIQLSLEGAAGVTVDAPAFEADVTSTISLSTSAAASSIEINANGSGSNLTVSANSDFAISAGSSLSFDSPSISFQSHKLEDVATPTSSTDAATKGYVDTGLALKQSLSEKGQANGYASLDSGGKVPVAQLPNSIMEYKGTYNASTNTPSLADGTGNTGDVYRISVAGSHDFGSGSITFVVGDYVIYNGSVWERSHSGADNVTSVFGRSGVVTATSGDYTTAQVTEVTNLYYTQARFDSAFASKTTDDLAEGTTNLYFTVERAQDAVASALTDSATIAFTYNDGANTITAAVKDNSISAAKLTTGVADQDTITGGNGSTLAVQASPLSRKSLTAGESMAANTTFAVRYAVNGETSGRAYKADKDASSTDKFYVVGLALSTSSVSAGNPTTVIMHGTHTLGSSDTPFSSSDIGKAVFLTSAGAFSLTAPSSTNEAVLRIGVVETTTKIWVDRQVVGVN